MTALEKSLPRPKENKKRSHITFANKCKSSLRFSNFEYFFNFRANYFLLILFIFCRNLIFEKKFEKVESLTSYFFVLDCHSSRLWLSKRNIKFMIRHFQRNFKIFAPFSKSFSVKNLEQTKKFLAAILYANKFGSSISAKVFKT